MGKRATAKAAIRGVVASIAVFGLAVFSAAAQSLDDRLNGILQSAPDLEGATVSVRVSDARTGRSLHSFDTAQTGDSGAPALMPASNMKLITTGAALHVLGPAYEFETRLAVDGDRLILTGSGDPAFGDPAMLRAVDPPLDPADLLDKLIDAAIAQGVGSVGEIICDDRVFDRVWTNPTWERDDLSEEYGAEVGGLSYHANVLTFSARVPKRDGVTSPQVDVLPLERTNLPWVEVANRAGITTKGRSAIWVARPRPENRFTLRGSVRRNMPTAASVPVHEPPLFLAHSLADRLVARGISTGGSASYESGASSVRLAEIDERFDSARTVAVVKSAMSDVARRTNTRSQNLYAEALLKAIGHEVTGQPGSWQNGTDVLRMLLAERLGPGHAAASRLIDGSGLSRENRLSTETIAAWLTSMYTDPEISEAFIDTLPSEDEGTLRRWLGRAKLSGEVRAKTGGFQNEPAVRALSGYHFDGRGRALVFSFIANDLSSSQRVPARELAAEIVAEIDDWAEDR